MKPVPLFSIVMASLMTLPCDAWAGPGHDHPHEASAPGMAGKRPLYLSATQRQNLGLQTVEAEVREMGRSLDVPATLVVPPERRGLVTALFAGRVTDIRAKAGQDIRQGEPVLVAEPLQLGSSPQTLESPISGRVIRVLCSIGAAFTPETPLVEIADDSELLAQGVLFQSAALNQIRLGSPARFTVDIEPDASFDGVLQRIDTGHESDDPSFHLYALIPNPAHRLRPNLRGRLAIRLEEPRAVVAIPRRAVLGSMGERFVFVEREDGHFERRAIAEGIRDGNWVEVIEGLLPGERVVTVGNYQLQFVAPEGSSAGASALDEHGHAH